MVAYISRINYPDPSANSAQTIQMAAALAEFYEHTCLFVHDISTTEEAIRREYGIEAKTLKLWQLNTDKWPGPLYKNAMLRFLTYNTGIAAILSTHPDWRKLPSQDKVLFVRSRLEILYWGRLRPYLRWFKDWLFVCEIHDLPSLAAEMASIDSTQHAQNRKEKSVTASRARRMAQALKNYDLVIAVNQALAEDISKLTLGLVQTQVVPLCSGLARLPHPPAAAAPDVRFVIGYFGTIDLAHGIDTAIHALQRLPKRFVLRLTGRIREDAQAVVEAGIQTGNVEWTGPVPYAQMASKIDACHVALVPAGSTLHATRYRSPLKIFDAMLRGKAILAADVDCHRELLSECFNAAFYKNGDAQDLAVKLLALAENTAKIERLALNAWQTSSTYTYSARAKTITTLMDETRAKKRARQLHYA